MKRVIFDIETNGFLEKLDRIHCLCIRDIDTGETLSCTDDDDKYPGIVEGLKILDQAETLIGHNIIHFDIPAIQKVYPEFLKFNPLHTDKYLFDTLICTRVIWQDLRNIDFERRNKVKREENKLPGEYIGRHSLEAWGHRLKVLKGDYAKEKRKELLQKGIPENEVSDAVWATWNVEMQDYCEKDVDVTWALYQRIVKENFPMDCLNRERDFHMLMQLQMNAGWPFDTEKAHKLLGQTTARYNEIREELHKVYPGYEVRKPFTPKRNNKVKGYIKGKVFFKREFVTFNPASRDHIAKFFKEKYKWKPKQFTPKDGKPKIDEDILNDLPYPEAALIAEYLQLEKIIGYLGTGKNSWLKSERDGRIYGRIDTAGTVTGRCSHSKPNVAQVPSVKKPWGKECRELFITMPGYKLVGVDASGLELRCLAHYLAKYDKGAYIQEVTKGDVHTVNQIAAGLSTRDEAKTFIYAFLYGAGDLLLGKFKNGTRQAGKKLRSKFLANLPALRKLIKKIKKKVQLNSEFKGLDGRIIRTKQQHSALNYLCQSAGAIIMKQATILFYYKLHEQGFVFGNDYVFVGNIHDELQTLVKEEHAETVGQLAVKAIIEAGEVLNFKCPLDGESKIGNNWSETH